MRITKAILPVAGRGTRVMPLTLHQPKGMINIADRPMIHYVIDELVGAGIKEIVIVLGNNQDVFKNYIKYLQQDKNWKKIKFHFIKQAGLLGNGDAVYITKRFIKKGEPFVVAFSDDLFRKNKKPLNKMVDLFYKKNTPILLLQQVPKKEVYKYGVVRLGSPPVVRPAAKKITQPISIIDLVEKPPIEQAPSNLTSIGRYVLPYEIFNNIKNLYPYQGREIYLAEAIQNYIKTNRSIWGLELKGGRFDCGSKIGLMQAQIYFSRTHPEIKNSFSKSSA